MGGGMAEYLNFYALPYATYPSALFQEMIVSLLVPLLAALLPIYNSMRVTVREAVSDYGIGSGGKPKQKSVNKGVLFIPRPIRLSLRNAIQKRTRLALTLFTLVLGGAIFIGVYNHWASFDKAISWPTSTCPLDVTIASTRLRRSPRASREFPASRAGPKCRAP
jgi:putative ABC transport system permease protein